MIKAADIMTRDVVTVEPDTPIKEAAAYMLSRGIGSLGVEKSGRIVGIVTDRDFVMLLAEKKKGAAKVVKDIMSSPPIKIPSNSDIIDVIKMMGKNKIKHVFVEEEGSIVGIITLKDVVVSAPEFIMGYIMEKLSGFDIPELK